MISNIWNHPKTSVAGLLIAIVTVGGVLSQQGVTLGHAGTGTVVALIGAIATALLGLLGKDPSSSSSSSSSNSTSSTANSTVKLGVLMLCAIVLSGTMPVIGCTQQQKISVAQAIVNWEPAFVSTADMVSTAIEQLAPATAVALGPITVAINAAGPQFQQAAENYLKNPSETNLQLLQAIVTQIQQNVNAALLAAAKIVDPTSQATATKDVNALAAIVNSIFGLVQSISTKAQLAQMAKPIALPWSKTPVHITYAQVRPYTSIEALQAASDQTTQMIGFRRVSANEFFSTEARMGF